MKKIKNITPVYSGYKNYPVDEEGKITLDTDEKGKLMIYRRNTVNYGNGLLGLVDGSAISTETWEALREGFYLVEEDGTKNWHYCLGGSDSGSVVGVNKWSNCAKVYDRKIFGKKDEVNDDTKYLFEYGHVNEELIAKGFASLTKLEVVKNDTVFFNEGVGFLQANVDFFVRHEDGSLSILEIKSTNGSNYSVINDYKNHIVPMSYYTQAVLHYPMTLSPALDIRSTYFAVAYDNSRQNIICCHFDRDKEQEEVLLAAEREFIDCLCFKQRPDENKTLTNGGVILENLKKKFPVAEEKSVKLGPAASSAVSSYLDIASQIASLKSKIKLLEAQQDLSKAMIIDDMKEACVSEAVSIDGTNYIVTYGNEKRESINKTVLKEKYPEVAEEIITSSAFRRLKITKEKKGKKK